jgi:hypothetical protein
MQYQSPRPPATRWEVRAVEDRARSIEDGIARYRDVLFVTLIPPGGKDDVSYPADEWIDRLREQMKRQITLGLTPADPQYLQLDWYDLFVRQYEAAKAGMDVPVTGTPVSMCMFLTPSEQKACQDAHVRTLEDLASANEQTISKLGWTGRQIKDKAVAALKTQESGKGALQLDAITLKLQQLEAQLQAKDEEVAALHAALAADRESGKKKAA